MQFRILASVFALFAFGLPTTALAQCGQPTMVIDNSPFGGYGGRATSTPNIATDQKVVPNHNYATCMQQWQDRQTLNAQSYQGHGDQLGLNQQMNVRHYTDDHRFFGGQVWVYDYRRFGYECPPPPPYTRAPKGYRWKCVRDIDANIGGYMSNGSGLLVPIIGLVVLAAVASQ